MIRFPSPIPAPVLLVALHATICAVSPIFAADWYVAPHGDDMAAGSIEQPFATIQRAQDSADAGDSVFIRGGTYRMTQAQLARRRGLYARITVLDKSGTAESPSPIALTRMRSRSSIART